MKKERIKKSLCYLAVLLVALAVIGCNSNKAIEHYNKGLEYNSSGQTDLAEQQYNLAIKEDSELAEAYLNLGLLYVERGWLEGGEENTLKAIELLEKNQKTIVEGATWEETLSLAYNNMGVLEINKAAEEESNFNHEEAFKHWRKAISFFEEAISLDTNNSRAQVNLQQYKDNYNSEKEKFIDEIENLGNDIHSGMMMLHAMNGTYKGEINNIKLNDINNKKIVGENESKRLNFESMSVSVPNDLIVILNYVDKQNYKATVKHIYLDNIKVEVTESDINHIR